MLLGMRLSLQVVEDLLSLIRKKNFSLQIKGA